MSSEIQSLRNDVAGLHGVVVALDANVRRLADDLEAIDKKLEHRMSWRDRAAWLYAGGVTALAAGATILHFLGRL